MVILSVLRLIRLLLLCSQGALNVIVMLPKHVIDCYRLFASHSSRLVLHLHQPTHHSGGRGMLGLPLEAKDVSKEALLESFPTAQVLLAWSRGEEAEWPPMDDDDEQDFSQRPPLRFDVGQRVVCRVGPDPVTGWAPGRVIMLWYREPTWPANSWAPYKIELDDGRNIFAPGDVDQIIREHNG